jgi:3-deoxy-D-manno-octulosonic-acid transferase
MWMIFVILRPWARIGILNSQLDLKSRTLPESWSAGCYEVWIHAASMGELRAAINLAQLIVKTNSLKVIITVQRSSTIKLFDSTLDKSILIQSVPFDFSGLLRQFVLHFGIKSLILYESEFYPAMIQTAHSCKIPIYLASGRIKPRSYKLYQVFSFFWTPIFSKISHAFVQSDIDQSRFFSLGIKSIEVAGNWKLLYPMRERSAEYNWDVVFLSMHLSEFKFINRAIVQLLKKQKQVLIVPRYQKEFSGFKKQMESDFINHTVWPNRSGGPCLYLKYGGLSEILTQARACVVGGSFITAGVHDVWEPLLSGCDVWVGNNFRVMEDLPDFLFEKGLVQVLKNQTSWSHKQSGKLKTSILKESRENSYAAFQRLCGFDDFPQNKV